MTKRDRQSICKNDAILNGLYSSTEWVGSSCGQHGSYVFYKGIRYRMPKQSYTPANNCSDETIAKTNILTRTKRRENRISSVTTEEKILGLGEFFFLQFREEDPICIGELQLLWHDKQSDQDLSSSRLYYVPETTPTGRISQHGQDEVLAVSEKVVMRVSDLVTLLVEPSEWDYGCKMPSVKTDNGKTRQFCVQNTLQRYGVLKQGFTMDDVEASKKTLRESTHCDKSPRAEVTVLSLQMYNRYKALLSRLGDIDNAMISKHLGTLTALGLHVSTNDRARIVFCRDSFDYPQLLEHEFVCEELAAVFKGRPRKKNKRTKCQSRRNEVCSAKELTTSSARRVSARQKTKKRSHYDNFALIEEYKPKRRNRKRTNSSKISRDGGDVTPNGKSDVADNKDYYSPSSADDSADSPKRRKRKNNSTDQNSIRKDLKLSLLASKNGNFCPNSTNKESNSSSGSITPASEIGDKSSTPTSPFSSASSPVDSFSDVTVCHDNGILCDDAILKLVPQNKDEFLSVLYKHMQGISSPINKIPSLGFKRIDLWAFFQVSQQFGGYKQITDRRLWKHVYDKMGGNPSCTSAATSTRKHYEKLLLPFEKHLRAQMETNNNQSTDKKKAERIPKEPAQIKHNDNVTVTQTTMCNKPELTRDQHATKHDNKEPRPVNGITHLTNPDHYLNLEKVAHEIIKAELFAGLEKTTPFHRVTPVSSSTDKSGSPPPLVSSNNAREAHLFKPQVSKESDSSVPRHQQQYQMTHTPRCSNAPPPFVPRKTTPQQVKENSSNSSKVHVKQETPNMVLQHKEGEFKSSIKNFPNSRKFDINSILFGSCGDTKVRPPPLTARVSPKLERLSPRTNGVIKQQPHRSETKSYYPDNHGSKQEQPNERNHKIPRKNELPTPSKLRESNNKYTNFHDFAPHKLKQEYQDKHIHNEHLRHKRPSSEAHRSQDNHVRLSPMNHVTKDKREPQQQQQQQQRHMVKDWQNKIPTSSRISDHFPPRSFPHHSQPEIPKHSTPNRRTLGSSDPSQVAVEGVASMLHSLHNPQVQALLARLPLHITSVLLPTIPKDCTPEMLNCILSSLAAGQPAQVPMELLGFPGATSPLTAQDRGFPRIPQNGQMNLGFSNAYHEYLQHANNNNQFQRHLGGGLIPPGMPNGAMNQMHLGSQMPQAFMNGLQGLPSNGLSDDPQNLVNLYQMYMYQLYASQMAPSNKPPDSIMFQSPKPRPMPSEYDWKFPI